MREGVETVAVSRAPVFFETSAAVAPPVVVGAAALFPPAVQDLARFFLKPDGILVPGSGCGWCGCSWFCIRSRGLVVPFCSGWRGSRLWWCVGNFFSGGSASFLVSLLCPVRPVAGHVRRSPLARVDIVVALPAVVPRVRVCLTWGLLPVLSSLFSPACGGGGGFLSLFL